MERIYIELRNNYIVLETVLNKIILKLTKMAEIQHNIQYFEVNEQIELQKRLLRLSYSVKRVEKTASSLEGRIKRLKKLIKILEKNS